MADTKEIVEQAKLVFRCYNCKKEGNLHRCSSCYSVRYCSRECQKQNWKIHKPACLEVKERFARGSALGLDFDYVTLTKWKDTKSFFLNPLTIHCLDYHLLDAERVLVLTLDYDGTKPMPLQFTITKWEKMKFDDFIVTLKGDTCGLEDPKGTNILLRVLKCKSLINISRCVVPPKWEPNYPFETRATEIPHYITIINTNEYPPHYRNMDTYIY